MEGAVVPVSDDSEQSVPAKKAAQPSSKTESEATVAGNAQASGNPSGPIFVSRVASQVFSWKAWPKVKFTRSGAAAPAADEPPSLAGVAEGLARTTRNARIALGASVLALGVGLTTPWWQPVLFDNDIATRQAAILASVQIRQLAQSDRPFVPQLSLLVKALPQDEKTTALLAEIAPLAASGVPTFEVLQQRFRGTADQVLVGYVVDKDDQSWLNWGIHKLAALVRIDTLAETIVAPPADVQVVHDAEEALRDRDLSRAVDQIARLEGQSGRVVQSWLSDARDRVNLDQAVAALIQQTETRAQTSAWLRATDSVSRWIEKKKQEI